MPRSKTTWLAEGARRPWRERLSEAQQKALVQDYLAGMTNVEMERKYELSRPQIYVILRIHNVKPLRSPHSDAKKPHCAICGRVREKPLYNPANCWYALPTCGDPCCKSVLRLRPDLRKRENPSPYRRPKVTRKLKRWDWDPGVRAQLHGSLTTLPAEEAAQIEKLFALHRDERFADTAESARIGLWNKSSSLAIAVRLVSMTAGDTALQLDGEQPREDFLRRFFGSTDVRMLSGFDVLYLWRCSCTQQTTFVVRELAAFPCIQGSHGVCSRCGAAALEIGDGLAVLPEEPSEEG